VKKNFFLSVIVLVFILTSNSVAGENLMVFCGAAFRLPTEEAIKIFQKKTELKVHVVYGGVGTLFSQIILSKKGDIFVSPSPDIMEKIKAKGLLVPDSVTNLAYVVPCINVQKGNPKNIKELKDLTRPSLKIAIGNPEIVYIGMLAVEIVDKNFTARERDAFRKNVVAHAEDFNKLATWLVLGYVDAIIGFHFLEGWYPDKVETVKLRPEQIQRIGCGQAAIIAHTRSQELAQQFITFLNTNEVKDIFRRCHYFGSPEEAFHWIGMKKPVGGGFVVP